MQYLLQHTERLIGDMAMQCGFEDSNYFSVVFKPGNRHVAGAMAAAQSRRRSKRSAMISSPFPGRRYWRR
jgi:AraC family L-rhamnose operon transcriptional activator RhaR